MARKPTGNPPGRPKGAKNKQSLDVKELAQEFTAEAVERLARVMRLSDSDAAVVAAARELLDRGHGKPKQVVDADVRATFTELRRTLVDPQHPDS